MRKKRGEKEAKRERSNDRKSKEIKKQGDKKARRERGQNNVI